MATAASFSYAQLEQLWINAGGSAATAPVAAAIAEAESLGNPQAVNPSDNNGTQTSWGLWQISNGTHVQPVSNILDPTVNAQQAVAKYQGAGNSFSPWGTYTSGAYKADLSSSTTPDPNVPASTNATLTAATQAAAAASTSTCLIGFTSPSVLGIGGGTVCLLSKANMRAIIGGGLLIAAGTLALAGIILVVGVGLGQSRVTSRLASFTPAGKLVSAVS
jgi:hypothetical protein